MKTINSKYLIMAMLLIFASEVHAMRCANAAGELSIQNQNIREETGRLNTLQAQYDQLRARTNRYGDQWLALRDQLPIQQGYASQLQLLMQALAEVKRDFSPARVDEAAQAFQQFNGFEAAIAPVRQHFDLAIQQTSVAEKEISIGSAMDQLGQLIETESASLLALERAISHADDLYQNSSREDDQVFDMIGKMGANIIRRETVRDDAQNSLENCIPEPREPIAGAMGRF